MSFELIVEIWFLVLATFWTFLSVPFLVAMLYAYASGDIGRKAEENFYGR